MPRGKPGSGKAAKRGTSKTKRTTSRASTRRTAAKRMSPRKKK